MNDRLASRNKNRTLIHLLQERASQHPDQTAYTFLEDGEREISGLTYRQLDEKAKAIAAYLQAQLMIGDRVLLVYPQGLETIAALFGCLYAGMIAIPAPAPETARLKRTLPRLEAIAADAGASLILTTTSLLTKRDGNLTFQAKSFVGRFKGRSSLLLRYYLAAGANTQETSHLATSPWIATETIPTQLAAHWQTPNISGDTLAYLQYTSGSTSTPKGVMLDHANLMGHLAALQQAGGYDSNSATVTWMPYDYGLVEGILEPLYNGNPCYLMSPTAFIKQPLRWLKAISKYGATHSQAPNFAYAYCLKRITPEERDTLDLSQWQAAGNAAEPINPEVMEQFCQTFTSCGFRPHAFAPAYGLAEATLLVTTSRKAAAPVFCTVDGAALAQHRLVETLTGHRLAGSGRLLGETQVVIVHPETLTRCAPDQVGEIWVASAGVARGYWQRPDATQETFCAYLADRGEGAFLRTGDLGFIKDGELFVTGRLKDLIIIRGENYYPQDLEWVVEKSHPALRSGCGAAFSIEGTDTEQIVVIQEVEGNSSENLDSDEIINAIRNALAAFYELSAHAVMLLKRDSIPKTSSGKIQRQACRSAFLDGSLNSLATCMLERASSQQEIAPEKPLEFQLVQIWQQVLCISPISTKDNFFELGGDSLKTAILTAEIERLLGRNLPLAILAEAPTVEQLASLLSQQNKKIESRSLVSIKPSGYKRPFFSVHAIGGDGGLGQSNLMQYLDSDRPFYGLQAVGLDGEQAPYTRMEDMVSHYIQEIQTVQPEGPYLLGGGCVGGTIAFEMAQELKKRGQRVLLVIMTDSPNPFITEEEKTKLKSYQPQPRLREELINKGLSLNQVENIFKVWNANIQVIASHTPQVYQGRVVYLAAQEQVTDKYQFDPLQPNGWNNWVKGGIEVHKIPGNHVSMGQEPHVQVLIEKWNACLEEADRDYEREKVQQNRKLGSRSLVPIKSTGWKQPFFYIHGADGHTVDSLLGKYIDPARPFYGIRAVGRDGEEPPHTCVEEMAAYYIQEIQTVQPEGPYLLGGRCTGGNIAFEMVQQLKQRGQQVLLVVMVDSPKPLLTEEEKTEYPNAVAREKMNWRGKLTNNDSDLSPTHINFNSKVFEYNLQIPVNYVPQVYLGHVVYFAAQERSKDFFISSLLEPNAWNRWVRNGVKVYEVPGDHLSMTKEPHVRVLAEKLSHCLDRAEYEEQKQGKSRKNLSSKHSVNQQLEEKGYTVIDFFSGDEVLSLLKLYKENPIPRDLIKPVVSATICSSDLAYRRQIAQEAKRIFIPQLEFLFPNHKVACCTFISKKSDESYSGVDLHQDRSFADETNLKTFGVWCPLVDVNEQNGCFQVVPKSHWLNSIPRSSNGFPYSQEILSLMKQKYLTSVPMRVGQALVYDNRLFHGSFPNLTSAERVAVICVLTPKDNPVLFYYRDPQTPNKLEVFEVDDTFYDSYIQGEKPENAISLGSLEYEVAPITPEQLVEFMNTPRLNEDKEVGIKEKFLSLFNLLRGNDWWLYKIPPLLAVAYAEILLQTSPPQKALFTLLALLASMFFVAAYGHVVNDIFDIRVDLQAGKQNRMAALSIPQRFLLCVTLTGLGLAPWLFIGFSTQSAILLAAIYILLTLYSAPPLRLKERDILGVVTDAAQVHAVPTLLVATVFSHLADTPQPQSVILATVATAWAFLTGIRGILLHQIWDRDSDLSAGVTTLVTRIGIESARSWITYFSFPLELLLFSFLILVIAQFAPSLLIFCALYSLVRTITTQSGATDLDPAPAQKAYILPHDFYEVWLPLALLTLLALREPLFLLLLVAHIGLFYPAIAHRVAELNRLLHFGFKEVINLVNKSESELQQIEQELSQLKTNFQQSHEESEQLRFELKQANEQLQSRLQQSEQKLAQLQSELHSSRTELIQFILYLQQTQKVEGPIDYYRWAISAKPDDLQLYYQALEIKPDDVQIHLQLGNTLVRQGQIDEAIAAYQTALQFHPDNFELHFELAKTLENEQQWDRAISVYKCAIELNPDSFLAHQFLGDVLAEQGHIHEASSYYRRALQLQPSIA